MGFGTVFGCQLSANDVSAEQVSILYFTIENKQVDLLSRFLIKHESARVVGRVGLLLTADKRRRIDIGVRYICGLGLLTYLVLLLSSVQPLTKCHFIRQLAEKDGTHCSQVSSYMYRLRLIALMDSRADSPANLQQKPSSRFARCQASQTALASIGEFRMHLAGLYVDRRRAMLTRACPLSRPGDLCVSAQEETGVA